MEETILRSLAIRLGCPEKKDDGYKFSNIEDVLLFIGIAARFTHIEYSEDYALMSVLITPKPPVILPKRYRPDRLDYMMRNSWAILAQLDEHIAKEEKALDDMRKRIEARPA